MQKLSDSFENVWIITGNHDLFYHRKRDLYSFPYAELFENVHIINDHYIIQDDVALVPWLVEDEWKDMKKIQARYIFGHFELPYFLMNAIVKMPNHNTLQASHFLAPEYVFSGHFHKRQKSDKIHYIGNPFGHNYNDVWDDERGCMFLQWDGEPEYVNFEGPRFVNINLSTLIDHPEQYLNPNTFCKAILDVPIIYEEAHFIKETFTMQFTPRELNLIPQAQTDDHNKNKKEVDLIIETVDQIVCNQLQSVDSNMIKTNMLLEIYNKL